MNDKETTQQFLCQFPRQIEGLVYLFLQSIAQEGVVCKSGYALAKQLGIYRTTLFRILRHLQQQRCIRLVSDNDSVIGSKLTITLLLDPSKAHREDQANVTLQPENVTSQAEEVTLQTEEVTLQTEEVTLQAEEVTLQAEEVTLQTDNNSEKPKETVSSDPFELVSTPQNTYLGHLGHGNSANVTHHNHAEQQKKSKEENPPAPPKEEIKRKKTHNRAAVRQQTLEMRKKAFIDSLMPFSTRYDAAMIRAFADYWTEPNRSLTRMRFEMQKTWSTPLRLATWARNEASFGRRKHYESRPSSIECVNHAQQWAIEESMRIAKQAEDNRLLRQQFLHSL